MGKGKKQRGRRFIGGRPNPKAVMEQGSAAHDAPQVVIEDMGGGLAQISVNLQAVPPPQLVFSADAAIVEAQPHVRAVCIYFLSTLATKIRSVVRVRFPFRVLLQQLEIPETQAFLSTLDTLLEDTDWSAVPTYQLKDLEGVESDRVHATEGTVMYMARDSGIALCDVFWLPSDAGHRFRNLSETPELQNKLRITLPTVVLYKMLKDVLHIRQETP